MLFRKTFLEGIQKGTVTVAFRRWRRPTVRAGGTLMTALGQLTIGAITEIDPGGIYEADARRAGYGSLEALIAELDRGVGDVYRIEIGELRDDPRVALRESAIDAERDFEHVLQRLQRLDAHSPTGPWTIRVLELIRTHPGLRAGDLCQLAGEDKMPFKLNVRKLKNLGLTESLEIGYRLSPRGETFLQLFRSKNPSME